MVALSESPEEGNTTRGEQTGRINRDCGSKLDKRGTDVEELIHRAQ